MTRTTPTQPPGTRSRRRRPSPFAERAMRPCLLRAAPARPPDPPPPPEPPVADRRRGRVAAVLACLAVVGVCTAAATLPAGPPITAPAATAPAPPAPPAPTGPAPPPPPGAGAPVAPGAAPGARYAWPLHPAPAVRTPFRPPAHPFGPGHRGVDLAGAPGATVLAARAGTVVFAAPVGGVGVVSVLHDDGLRTTYQPVRPLVAAGTAVAVGQPLGLLDAGHPGCPDPACLHWGVRRAPGDYLDPLVLLRPPRVRLLPLPDPWPLGAGARRPGSAGGQLLQPPAQPTDQPGVQLADA